MKVKCTGRVSKVAEVLLGSRRKGGRAIILGQIKISALCRRGYSMYRRVCKYAQVCACVQSMKRSGHCVLVQEARIRIMVCAARSI